LGLVALSDFPEGAIVGPYPGNLLSTQEFEILGNADYVLELKSGLYLDGGPVCSFTKYINTLYLSQHTRYGGFNCRFVHNRKTHTVSVVTTQPVTRGSEFFIDYNTQ
jgi:hypothetical protein